MPHVEYLVVGGGVAADAAVQGIRELNASASIALVGDEPDPPYNRPPLSKALWKGGSLADVWRPHREGVELHLGHRALSLDPQGKRVVDDHGVSFTFEKLLLATGGSPRRLPFGQAVQVVYFRTLADYRFLREKTQGGGRFAVIGGGFIGSEIAAALALNGVEVVMVSPEPAIGSRIFPEALAAAVTARFRDRGVEVLTHTSVTGLQPKGDRTWVELKGPAAGTGDGILVDGVVAGIGIEPNIQLASAAGLEVENGIAVSEQLRTSHPDIYAAGDVASFPSFALGRRLRVEHEDNANSMGRIAGRNMAGTDEAYRHIPFFYSDLFDMGYEAVGDTDSRLETVADWKEPYREGVVHYLRGGRVRGVLLWNVWDRVEAARQLIADSRPFRPQDLQGRLSQ